VANVHADPGGREQLEKAGVHRGVFWLPAAGLVGEVLGTYDAPIDFNVREGKGTIRVGQVISAEMQPYTDAQGRPTKLVDSIFSTIPGSPAYVGKAMDYKANIPEHNMVWEMHGRNAVLGDFRLEG